MPVLKMKFRYAYLLCLSEADSTFKAYYAGFMRWKKLLRMVLTCWICSQEIRFMLHLFIFFSTNKSSNTYFSKLLNWIQVVIHSGYDNCISVAIYVSFTFRNKNRHITRFENNIAPFNISYTYREKGTHYS
jgi:hypothetical protein